LTILLLIGLLGSFFDAYPHPTLPKLREDSPVKAGDY
jgi:hypothetical protein